jgi:hypothetical protein
LDFSTIVLGSVHHVDHRVRSSQNAFAKIGSAQVGFSASG